MPLYITEYAYMGSDVDGKPSPLPKDQGRNHTAYIITTASRNAATFNSTSRFARVISHTAVLATIGADVSASNGALIPANVERVFAIDPALLFSFKMFV